MSDTNLPCGCTSVPHTCDTLPVGTTTYVCASVVCKTKTWGKCVLYGGDDIGCTYYTGGVSGFTKTGVGGDSGSLGPFVLPATGGSGTGATFTVSQVSPSANYIVTVAVAGSGYKVGDVLTILASVIYPSGAPYASPANDIVITITSLSNAVGTVVTQISHEDDFDTIIQNLNDRICSATPSGLDYGTFNYTCLKQSGVLGTGTAIVTQKQFTESASAALCAINTRVLAIEKPAVTVPTCFSGVITSGTSTLVQVLNEILTKVCSISTAFSLPVAVSDIKCFTTAPSSSASVGDWFQWVVNNTCSINTTLTSSISTQTTRVNNINTYLHGTNSPSYPITYDLSCSYIGGSATANVHTTLTALITKLCALGATVGGLPSLSSISMAWSTCFTSYGYSNSATTLQTQLDRILNVISREKAAYSTDFTVTDSACGKTVALASGALFDCSKLATCSITNLSDLDGTPTCGEVLTFDGTNYTPVERDEFLLVGGAIPGFDNVASYSGASVGPYLSTDLVAGCGSHRIITMGLLENPWTDLSTTIPSPNWSTPVTANTFYGKRTFEGNIVFRGIIAAGATILSVVNVPAGRTIATNLPTYLRPNVDTIIDGSVIFKANISNTEWALPGYFKITTGGAIIFFCNAVDPAAVTTRLGVMGNSTADHYFSFYGKVIYQ